MTDARHLERLGPRSGNGKYSNMEHKNTDRLRLRHWAAFWRQGSMEPIANAPLHVPKNGAAPEFDLDRIKRLARGTKWEEPLQQVLRFVYDEQFIDELVAKWLQAHPADATTQITKGLSTREVDVITTSDYFAEISPERLTALGGICGARFLRRGEPEKARNRLLTWTSLLNAAIEEEYARVKSSITDTLIFASAIRPGDKCRTFDVTASFFGFKFPLGVSKYCATKMKRNGKLFIPLRLPMGYRPSAELNQLVMCILAETACNATTGEAPHYHCHVDNVAIFGKMVNDAATQFITEATRCNMNITEDDPTTFIGMQIDYETAAVAVSKKTLAKLASTKQFTSGSSTFEKQYQLFALCVHMSRILRFPLPAVYTIFKYIRRRLATLRTAEEIVTVWPSITQTWNKWITALSHNKPTKHWKVSGSPSLTVFSDASLIGYGGVIVHNNTVYEVQGRWQGKFQSDDINRLEILALHRTLLHANNIVHLSGKHVIAFVDNTSTIHMARKGNSASFDCAKAVGTLITDLAKMDVANIAIGYIHTSKNPADTLSRVFQEGVADAKVRVSKKEFQLPPDLGAVVAESVKLPDATYAFG